MDQGGVTKLSNDQDLDRHDQTTSLIDKYDALKV
jgi:hypothetical protein